MSLSNVSKTDSSWNKPNFQIGDLVQIVHTGMVGIIVEADGEFGAFGVFEQISQKTRFVYDFHIIRYE